MKEDEDMYMDDEKWDSHVLEVRKFLKKYETLLARNEEALESVGIIKSQIKRGNKHPNRRKKFWHAISVEGGDLDDLFEKGEVQWPIRKKKIKRIARKCKDGIHPHCSICGKCNTNRRTHDVGHKERWGYEKKEPETWKSFHQRFD